MPRRAIVTGQAMHYPMRVRQTDVLISSLCDAAQETPIALTAAAVDQFVFTILEPVTVAIFRLLITTLINYDTLTQAAIVALDHRITYASETGRVELGTITIPDAAPAGEQIYTVITPTDLERGDQLVVEVTQAGTGGASIAGAWLPVIGLQSMDFEDITAEGSDAGLTLSV